VPYKLVNKLNDLGLNTTLCSWIWDFLTNRSQNVRIGIIHHVLSSLSSLILVQLFFTLFTHDCKSIHSPSNTIVKFADDTTIVGRISENYESHYRERKQASNIIKDSTHPGHNTQIVNPSSLFSVSCLLLMHKTYLLDINVGIKLPCLSCLFIILSIFLIIIIYSYTCILYFILSLHLLCNVCCFFLVFYGCCLL